MRSTNDCMSCITYGLQNIYSISLYRTSFFNWSPEKTRRQSEERNKINNLMLSDGTLKKHLSGRGAYRYVGRWQKQCAEADGADADADDTLSLSVPEVGRRSTGVVSAHIHRRSVLCCLAVRVTRPGVRTFHYPFVIFCRVIH